MKKGGRVTRISVLILLLLVMALIPLISANFFSNFWGKITGHDTKGLGVNVTVSSMNIISVLAYFTGNNLNSGPYPTGIMINFSVYNGAGVQYVNDSTVNVTLSSTLAGEVNRTNTTCYRTTEYSTYYVNYSCNVTMYWYDTNGSWNITAIVKDNNSNTATNSTQTVTVNLLTGFAMSPTNLTWPTMTAGAVNQTSSNDPLTLNNTGNKQIGVYGFNTNISVNATHLAGESNGAWRIFASNFTVAPYGNTGTCSGAAGNCIECDTTSGKATNMSFATFSNVTFANLTKGNYTQNNNYTGQEQLYFCLRTIDSALPAQAYSIVGNGSWIVQI